MADNFKNEPIKLPNDTQSLEKIANAIDGDTTIWEGGFFIPFALLVIGLALLAIAYENLVAGRMLFVAISFLISLFLFIILLKSLTRRHLPFMVLTKDGIVTSVFKTPLPWRGVEDFQINASKTNALNMVVGMEFTIAPHFLPEQNKNSRNGSYYDAKTKKLMIAGFNFRLETNRDTIIAQIHSYRNAAFARHKLSMNQSVKK